MAAAGTPRTQILRTVIANVLWLCLATVMVGAEIDFLPRFNRTQAMKVRSERSAPYMVRYQPYVPDLDAEDPEQYHSSITRKDLESNLQEYRSLCQVKVEVRHLRDQEYDYHPPLYHRRICSNPTPGEETSEAVESTQCSRPGFSCVQRWRKISVSRRRWDSDCWEPFPMPDIESNCECMWPKIRFDL